MTACLGLDTSNYTTSAAWADAAAERVEQQKQLLPVTKGKMGLRQSDAVFHHVRQLPNIVERLRQHCPEPFSCIAASERPQEVDGSYMPCFLVGMGAARELAAVMGVPYIGVTHQQGHVAAAAFGAGRMDLLDQPFLAFHVSGGTTDALTVEPTKAGGITCRVVARSLDLKAGQLIDRVGGMLGLPFPAGPALEQLALTAEQTYRPRIPLRDGCCSLSGVQNQCEQMLQKGTPPRRNRPLLSGLRGGGAGWDDPCAAAAIPRSSAAVCGRCDVQQSVARAADGGFWRQLCATGVFGG